MSATARVKYSLARAVIDDEAEKLVSVAMKAAHTDMAVHARLFNRDDRNIPLRPARHHQAWIDILKDRENFRWVVIVAPPGYAKSTWCSIVYPSWRIGVEGGKVRIGIISSTATQAQGFASAVRTSITNGRYPQTYPGVVPDDTRGWAKEQFWVKPSTDSANPTVMAAGMGGPITGKRFDEIILDDPTTYADARSRTIMEAQKTFVQNTVLTRFPAGKGPPDGDGRMVVVCCLGGDSRVPLDDGRWVEIRNIKKGDTVFAFDGDRIVPRAVLDQRSAGIDDTIVIKTGSRALTVNRRHPFLAFPGSKKSQVFTPEWVQAGDLAIGDRLVCAGELPTSNNVPANRWETTEKMWFLGFLFGDGWVTSWKHKGSTDWCVCAALGVDEELNLRIADEFKAAFGRRPRRCVKERYWRLDMASAGRELDILGLHPGVRALGKRIPEWVFGCESKLQRAFLRGLIVADGTKPKTGQGYVLTSGNRHLVEDARLLAMTCGVRVGSLRMYQRTVQPPNSPEPVAHLQVSAIFTFLEDGGRDARGATLTGSEIPDGLRVERIHSIEEGERQEVFDLAVDGEANFVAEGFVVHNTRWGENDLVPLFEDRGFKIIRMPAIGYWDREIDMQTGEVVYGTAPLWPGRHSLESLLEEKASNPINFELVYQGNARAMSGDLFSAEDFRYGSPPFDERHRGPLEHQITATMDTVVQFVDTASGKDRQRGDFFAMATVGIRNGGREVWILDMDRERYSAPDQEVRVIANIEKWNPEQIFVEDVNEGTALRQRLQLTTRYSISAWSPAGKGDKETRAIPLVNAYRARYVIHPAIDVNGKWVTPKWVNRYESELLAFPLGQHDDQVDAAVGAFVNSIKPGPRVRVLQ